MTEDSPLTSTGLVRELAELLYDGGNIPTNPDWVESLSAAIIGMKMGKQRWIHSKYGYLYGNIFVIFIGASGLSFKTVPLKDSVRPIVRKLTEEMNKKIIGRYNINQQEFKERWNVMKKAHAWEKKKDDYRTEKVFLENIKSQLVDHLTLQKFTSEKLTSFLNEFPWGIIVGDEYTKMWKGAKLKDYLSDNMEDLSRLYDCDPEKVGTISRGVEYPKDAYISFVSATTYYLLTMMTDDFFIQGTGNRFLWILDDEKKEVDIEKKLLEDIGFFFDIKDETARNQQIENIVKKLMLVDELPEGLIGLSYNADITLRKYMLEKFNEAVRKYNVDLLDKDANLIARLAENAMKLAMIHCIGRYVDEYDPDDVPGILEINEKDATWAIEKMSRHFDYYLKMKKVSTRVKKSITRSYTSDQERVLEIIDRFKKRGISTTLSRITQQTGWKKDDTLNLLSTMVTNKQIKVEERIKPGKKTQKITYYESMKGVS